MRTIHKTTAIVAALGIAFGVAACGTDAESVVAKTAPKATVTETVPTPTTTPTVSPAPVPTASPTVSPARVPTASPTVSPAPVPTASPTPSPLSMDTSLKKDLMYMATAQEIWITDHTGDKFPQVAGLAVTATKPGGTVKLSKNNVFHGSVGNVIAVKVYKAGYCISGYNKAAAKATSATKSFLYKSDKGGLQVAVGACSRTGTLASVDASLKSDLKNMATLQETYFTDHPTSKAVAVKATEPGGTATVMSRGDFHASPGNVIAVKAMGMGYCISGYNKAATRATSATMSLRYNSDKGGLQAALGSC